MIVEEIMSSQNGALVKDSLFVERCFRLSSYICKIVMDNLEYSTFSSAIRSASESSITNRLMKVNRIKLNPT